MTPPTEQEEKELKRLGKLSVRDVATLYTCEIFGHQPRYDVFLLTGPAKHCRCGVRVEPNAPSS